MVLTDTILAVAVALILISAVFAWVLMRARAREQAGGRGVEVSPAALQQLERLAEEINSTGPRTSTRELVAEALNLLFEKYDKPPVR